MEHIADLARMETAVPESNLSDHHPSGLLETDD
jgi:hypothetical protein